jgi:hypothetical protein
MEALMKYLMTAALFLGITTGARAESLKDYLAAVVNNPIKKSDIPFKHNKLRQCARDDIEIFGIERTVMEALRKSLLAKESANFKKRFSAKRSLDLSLNTVKKNIADGIQFSDLVAGKGKHEFPLGLTAPFAKVEGLELSIIDFTVPGDSRPDFDLSAFDKIQVKVHFDIRGLAADGSKRNDRGLFSMDLGRDKIVSLKTGPSLNDRAVKGASSWRIVDVKFLGGDSVAPISKDRAPRFRETTDKTVLAKLPIFLRTEAIRRGGYALSMADVNNDGHIDVLVGMRDVTKLFLGSKSGEYTEVKDSGLSQISYVKAASFADFRNRGIQDLVLTRLDPNENKDHPNGATSVLYFRGDGKGKFTKVDQDFGKKRWFTQPMPTSVGDFNNDGYLDLYVGYPGDRDFTHLSVRRTSERNVQGLYLNDKNGGFIDFTDQFNVLAYDYYDGLFPHSAIAVDFDQNGTEDILVADDRGNLSPALLNKGHGKFVESAEIIGLGNNGMAMTVAVGDIDNDGLTDPAISNVNIPAVQRSNLACLRHFGEAANTFEEGLRLFSKKGGRATYSEVNEMASINGRMGTGAAGFTFVDYDNDGLLDIYFTNGLWSGSENGEDVGALFAALKNYTRKAMSHVLNPEDLLSFKNFLYETEGRVSSLSPFQTSGNARPSMAGYQHNRLFRNMGDGTFADVAYLEGLDSAADGYIVGTADLSGTGRRDLILRNSDPGTKDHSYPVVQVYENIGANKANENSLTIKLEGVESNRDAIGTFIVAKIGKRKMVEHLINNNGSLQSPKEIHFGLGSLKKADQLVVHWPSGKTLVLNDVPAGELRIKEDSSQNHIIGKN